MMKGKERILTALSVKQPDRVPLYIHGINEAPIIGIGKPITDGRGCVSMESKLYQVDFKH